MTQGFLQGQIKALGLQEKTLKYSVTTYWCMHVPFSYLLSFSLGLQVKGFWIAALISTTTMGLAFHRIATQADWEEVAREADRRVNSEHSSAGKIE